MRSRSTSLAIDLWCSVKVPQRAEQLYTEHRKNVVNAISAAACIVDPTLRGENLSYTEKFHANKFFIQELTSDGALNDYQEYKNKRGIFHEISKRTCKATTFWDTDIGANKQLVPIVKDLISLPASAPNITTTRTVWNSEFSEEKNNIIFSLFYKYNSKDFNAN